MKYHQKAIIIPVLFLWNCLANAQVITGVVYDKATKLPVSDVHVYLDGMSALTITDRSGKFELRTRSVVNTRLALHHISYQTAIFDRPFDELPDTLYIEERINVIREVTVTADRFTREQKMKAFREQFLGLSRAGKSCTILNEEDIHFILDHQNRKLIASADKPLVVVNDYLRYQITFILIDFWVQYGSIGNRIVSLDNEIANQSFFSVVSSFTDLAPDNRRIRRRRDNVYESSSNYFFKSLSDETLKDNNFTIFEGSFPIDYKNFFSIKDTLLQKLISINVPRPSVVPIVERNVVTYNVDDIPDTVTIPDFMRNKIRTDSLKQVTIINGSLTSGSATEGFSRQFPNQKISGRISVLHRRKNQSDIYFMTDSFWIDRYGNIDKIEQIWFTGHFGQNRAGEMLPIDYTK